MLDTRVVSVRSALVCRGRSFTSRINRDATKDKNLHTRLPRSPAASGIPGEVPEEA